MAIKCLLPVVLVVLAANAVNSFNSFLYNAKIMLHKKGCLFPYKTHT